LTHIDNSWVAWSSLRRRLARVLAASRQPRPLRRGRAEKVQGLAQVRSIAVGYTRACALTDDQGVCRWGDGDDFRLGRALAGIQAPVEVVEARGAVAIDAAYDLARTGRSFARSVPWTSGGASFLFALIA